MKKQRCDARYFGMALRSGLLLCLPALISSCGLISSGPEIRYRITIEVDTPQGPRTGSGVWSFQLRPGDYIQSYNSRFKGEAIPVDLPNGKTLFALLDLAGASNGPLADRQGTLPERALPRRYFTSSENFPGDIRYDRTKQIIYIRQQMRARIQLDCRLKPPSSECPMLVHFRDINDPRTVEAVSSTDLSADFGAGYSLKGVFLQITDGQVTHQIGDRFSWEAMVDGKHLDGSGSNNNSTLASSLSILSFKRWDK